MQKNSEGVYVLKGILNAVSSGTVHAGNHHNMDYIEIDGERWGDIYAIGHTGEALSQAVGKNIEIHLFDKTQRIILGLKVEADKRFETIDPSVIKHKKFRNIFRSIVAPLILAAVALPFFDLFAKIAKGGTAYVVLAGILLFSMWIMDYANEGRLIRTSTRYIKKHSAVR